MGSVIISPLDKLLGILVENKLTIYFEHPKQLEQLMQWLDNQGEQDYFLYQDLAWEPDEKVEISSFTYSYDKKEIYCHLDH